MRGLRYGLVAAAVCAALSGAPSFAAEDAAQFPSRPVKLVVPNPPGGITDIIGRLIAEPLQAALGKPVVIDNKPGAGGLIGYAAVANAPADGYTLFMGSQSSVALAPLLAAPPQPDPVKDLAPVALNFRSVGWLVANPNFAPKTAAELVDFAKKNPGKVRYASSGPGSANHLAMALFATRAGVDLVHVPYRGAGPALSALLAGEVEIAIYDFGTTLQNVKAGKLTPIVQVGEKRSPVAPDLPTLHESILPGYTSEFWLGIFAPAGTPAPIVAKLNAAINEVMKSEAVKARAAALTMDVVTESPQALTKILASDVNVWGKVIRDNNIKAD